MSVIMLWPVTKLRKILSSTLMMKRSLSSSPYLDNYNFIFPLYNCLVAMDLSRLPDYMKIPDAVFSDPVEWKSGKVPDYSLVDALYAREKTKEHAAGSVEEIVTNLVKNWERELSHKKNFSDCRTMNTDTFQMGVNGKWFGAGEVGEIGNYNALIGESEYYAASRVPSSEESHHIFRAALKGGFAWECLEVYSSGFPRIAFKWRHWGTVNGEMKCPMRNGQDLVIKPDPSGDGRRVEVFGISVAELDENFKITKFDTFWNPDLLMQQMAGQSEGELKTLIIE